VEVTPKAEQAMVNIVMGHAVGPQLGSDFHTRQQTVNSATTISPAPVNPVDPIESKDTDNAASLSNPPAHNRPRPSFRRDVQQGLLINNLIANMGRTKARGGKPSTTSEELQKLVSIT
jgi:hypothetical protein